MTQKNKTLKESIIDMLLTAGLTPGEIKQIQQSAQSGNTYQFEITFKNDDVSLSGYLYDNVGIYVGGGFCIDDIVGGGFCIDDIVGGGFCIDDIVGTSHPTPKEDTEKDSDKAYDYAMGIL